MMIFAAPPRAQDAAPAAPSLDLSLEPLAAAITRSWSALIARPPQELAVNGALTFAVLLGAGAIMWLLERVLGWAAVKFAAPIADEEAAKLQRDSLGRRTRRLARIAVGASAAVLILLIWGVDVVALTGGLLGPFFGVAWRLALVVVLAFAALEIAHYAVAGTINRAAERAREPRRAAQLRTIAPVLRATLGAVIIVIAALTLLSELGLDVGPLLAGAGIVGLAIGFGAQTVVKDFITGLFLIFEDIVSIGDVAVIAGKGGVVESMTLRTIRLRGFDGTLYVFPYGEAQVIENMTKDFSFYVFDLSISYSSDIVRALEVMKQVGDALREDPEFGPMIMEPIEIVGVDKLGDSGVVLKARIKTYPIKQWAVGREYLKRVKLAFDAAGVEIPFPHLKLVAPDAPFPAGAPTRAQPG